jgi:hypothetical protein
LGQFRFFASFFPDEFSDVTGAPLGGGGASPLRMAGSLIFEYPWFAAAMRSRSSPAENFTSQISLPSGWGCPQ